MIIVTTTLLLQRRQSVLECLVYMETGELLDSVLQAMTGKTDTHGLATSASSEDVHG